MSVVDVSSKDAVLEALREFDELGEEAFLREHGFGPAKWWVLVHEGKQYPSKAILGVAYTKQYPDRPTLREGGTYSGGEATVVRKLRELGFTVERLDKADPVTTDIR